MSSPSSGSWRSRSLTTGLWGCSLFGRLSCHIFPFLSHWYEQAPSHRPNASPSVPGPADHVLPLRRFVCPDSRIQADVISFCVDFCLLLFSACLPAVTSGWKPSRCATRRKFSTDCFSFGKKDKGWSNHALTFRLPANS
jgi:hypothetical protein